MPPASDPLIGRTLSHYHVLDKIGAGGMGAVYHARDRRLHRDVALKVLAGPQASADLADPLLAEARAASALNHPNIVTIYDIAREEDVAFIVMEYVDGQPLDVLIRSGAMPPGSVIEYALQISDAMAAAHAAGIVHRDLKPANIIVSQTGRIRVLDFGIALLTAAAEHSDITSTVADTRPGGLSGTFAYMAPEQSGGAPVDHRSDLFSFGVLLYEMLCGERPFQGNNAAALIRAVHSSEPDRLAGRVGEISPALEALVHQLLSKEPADRPEGMAVVHGRLKAIARGEHAAPSVTEPPAPGSERASLSVLPFVSLSAGQDDEHLAAGITAELTSALSGVPDLRVASPLASFRYKSENVDIKAVAKALNTRYILTGNLRRAGQRIRVTATLTDAAPGTQIWTKKYERDLEDIFAVQEEIAAEIVGATGGELLRIGADRASRSATESLDAWGLVRKAYHFWNHAFKPEGVHESLELLRRAVGLDPGYAAAHSFLSIYLAQRVVNFISPSPEADIAESFAAGARALDLAPRDPEVLQNVGLIHFNLGRYEDAVAILTRAVKVAPFNLVAWGYLACAHGWSGRTSEVEEGLRILDRLLKTAPDHPSVPYWLYFKTSTLLSLGRAEDAMEPGRHSVELQPYYYLARFEFANALGQAGRLDEARKEIATALSVNPTITPAGYIEGATRVCYTPPRVEAHVAGLRAAGWLPPLN